MDCAADHRSISLGRSDTTVPDPRPRCGLRCGRHPPIASHGHPGQADRAWLTVAKRLCRENDRNDLSGVRRPCHCTGRAAFAPDPEILRCLFQLGENTSLIEHGLPPTREITMPVGGEFVISAQFYEFAMDTFRRSSVCFSSNDLHSTVGRALANSAGVDHRASVMLVTLAQFGELRLVG
jgi:hypothetical protein